jgi:hypothetical protein
MEIHGGGIESTQHERECFELASPAAGQGKWAIGAARRLGFLQIERTIEAIKY